MTKPSYSGSIPKNPENKELFQVARWTEINLKDIIRILNGQIESENISDTYTTNIITQAQAAAPNSTEWASFTPSGNWVTNVTYTGSWRRVGDSIDVRIHMAFAGAVLAAALNLSFLPNSLNVDLTKLLNVAYPVVGNALMLNSGTSTVHAVPIVINATEVGLIAAGSETIITNTAPFLIASGDSIDIQINSVPIVGWSNVLE